MEPEEKRPEIPGWIPVELVGAGPYGQVWRVRSAKDSTDVRMVKIIRVPPDMGEVERAAVGGVPMAALKDYFLRFRDDLKWELTLLGSIESVNLARPDRFVVEENMDVPGWTGYCVMPCCTPLPARVAFSPLTDEELLDLAAGICAALEELGKLDMVHGDITPENILIAETGDFVLADYGVRRSLERIGRRIFGAPCADFDAPEVKTDGAYSVQADIYALGLVLAWAANGGALPLGGDFSGIQEEHPALYALIRRAAAEDAGRRYVSAAEMAADVRSIQATGAVRPDYVQAAPETDADEPDEPEDSAQAAQTAAEATAEQAAPEQEPELDGQLTMDELLTAEDEESAEIIACILACDNPVSFFLEVLLVPATISSIDDEFLLCCSFLCSIWCCLNC